MADFQVIVIQQKDKVNNNKHNDSAVFAKAIKLFKKLLKSHNIDSNIDISKNTHIKNSRFNNSFKGFEFNFRDIESQDRVMSEEHNEDESGLFIEGNEKREQTYGNIGKKCPCGVYFNRDNHHKEAGNHGKNDI